MSRLISFLVFACCAITFNISLAAETKKTDPLKEYPELSRNVGQDKFVSIVRQSRGAMPMMASAGLESADAPSGRKGAQRAQQESDVFKVGPKGLKLLYLL